MKKIISFLFPLAILFSGCSQEELDNNNPDMLDGRIFSASFEQNETRTYVQEGNLLRWNKGDQITIFEGNTLNQQYEFDGETGDNSGTFSKVSSSFGTGNGLNCHYAVYPYDSDVKITEDGVITAAFPVEQNYAHNSFGVGANAMVAVTKDLDDTFLKFKNIGGYLKLQLYGDDIVVKSITLTGNNNEKLAGKASVTHVYGQEPTVIMSDDSFSSVILNCGEGVMIGSTAETATAFWIVVPAVIFETGFTISVTDVSGITFIKSTSNEISIERNVIKPMKAFKVEIENGAGGATGSIPDNQIWYTTNDGNIITPYNTGVFGVDIISNTCADGKGIITFDGKLRKIGSYAFYQCRNLTSVIIPNEVTIIESGAFDDCISMSSILIPESVTSIESYAFNCCYNLQSINIPDALTEIKERTFAHCYDLTEVDIPFGVTRIGNDAFTNCDGLKDVTIPNSVTVIGNSAFADCDGLQNITLPDGVTSLGLSAFFSCDNLQNINIPDGVTEIGDGTFGFCVNLQSIVLPDGLTSIGDRAFSYCSSLQSIVIPEGVTTIGLETFYNCGNLINITLPSNLLKIGRYAIACCWSLKNIEIPNTLTSIGDFAFFGCDGLQSIIIPDSVTAIGEQAFILCGSLASVTLSNSVTEIGYKTFYGCNRLTSITIPSSVTRIADSAFSNCFTLKRVDCKPAIPPMIFSDTFTDCSAELEIYVPVGSLAAYNSADIWKDMNVVTVNTL